MEIRLGPRRKTEDELNQESIEFAETVKLIEQEISRRKSMHYRNGREAKNGDKIVKLDGGRIVAFGVLHSATPGNDYCNGNIAVVQSATDYACMCDCLHVDDIEAMFAEAGLHKRPIGK